MKMKIEPNMVGRSISITVKNDGSVEVEVPD